MGLYMTMNSMTGFGQATGNVGGISLRVEVHSVNQRGLLSQINGPKEWPALEALVNQRLKESFQRGKFFVVFREESPPAEKVGQSISESILRERLEAYRTLAHRMGLPVEPSSEVFYRMMHEAAEYGSLPDWEESKDQVITILEKSLHALQVMRAEEGERLKADFQMRIDNLHQILERMRTLDKGRVDKYRNALLLRLEQMGLTLDISDERVLKEVALYADRCDISEELARLQSHMQAFTDLLEKKKGEVGRQMEFLLQEMHREANTIGSKANDAELSAIIIEGKQELEKMREQAANIE